MSITLFHLIIILCPSPLIAPPSPLSSFSHPLLLSPSPSLTLSFSHPLLPSPSPPLSSPHPLLPSPSPPLTLSSPHPLLPSPSPPLTLSSPHHPSQTTSRFTCRDGCSLGDYISEEGVCEDCHPLCEQCVGPGPSNCTSCRDAR